MNKNLKRVLLAVMVSSMLAASVSAIPVAADDTAVNTSSVDSSQTNVLNDVNSTPVSDPIWMIGDTGYNSLPDAVAAVPTDGTPTTIVLQKSITGPAVVINKGQNIILNLNGNTYKIDTSVGSPQTETNGFQLLAGSTVTIKNGTIVPVSPNIQILIQNYCNLTLDNVTLDGSNSQSSWFCVLSNNCGKTQLKGNTNILAPVGKYAIDVYYWPDGGYGEGVSVTLDKSMTGTVTGLVSYGCDNSETGKQDYAAKAILNIESGTFEGKFSTYGFSSGSATGINISGGSFSTAFSEEYLADSVVATVSSASGRMAVYTNFQTAVDAASSGDTVTVRKNGESATVDPNKGIKFKAANGVNLPSLTDQNGTKVDITEDGTTVQTAFTATINGVSTPYTKGQTVTITTPAYYEGHVFKNWVVSSGNVTLDNPYSATTTFTMPAANVTIYAVYDEITFVPVVPEQPTVTTPARNGWVKIGARWYLYDNGTKLTGWQKDGNTWYYLDEKGIMLCSGLTEIDGKTYYFYNWGGMAASWWYQDADGNWFYFRGNGAMATSSWIEWKGEYYYVGADGKMLTNTTTPDGYRVDANGAWIR